MNLIIRVCVLLLIVGCNSDHNVNYTVEANANIINIKSNSKTVYSLVNSPHDLTLYTSEVAYDIDTVGSILYFNNFNRAIIGVNLETFEKMYESKFPNSITTDKDYQVKFEKSKVILKTNKNLLVFDDHLNLEQSLIDTLFKEHPHLPTLVRGYWNYKVTDDSIKLNISYLENTYKETIKKQIYTFAL